MQTTTVYSMIVIPPFGSRGQRIQISRPAVLILTAAFILSFFATVALLLVFPRIHSHDTDRSRLAAENQTLKIENGNAQFRMRRLNAEVSHIEEQASQINALIAAD